MSRATAGTSNDPCAEITSRLDEAVDGTLPLLLAVHFDGCARCRSAADEVEAGLNALRAEASAYVHPTDFLRRLSTALDAAIDASGPPSTRGA